MMNRRVFRHTILWIIVVFLILGCASPAFVVPPPSTPNPVLVEGRVVSTAAAAQTQTAIHLPPSSTATYTPLATKTITITPSPTATVLLITETSVSEDSLLEEGGYEGGENGGGSINLGDSDAFTPIKREWACSIQYRTPTIGAELPRGTTFQAGWTVRNIGSKTWPKKGVDIVWRGGQHLHDGKPFLDIPTTVPPGGKVHIFVKLNVPKRTGEYSTAWTLMVGQTQFCKLKVTIISR